MRTIRALVIIATGVASLGTSVSAQAAAPQPGDILVASADGGADGTGAIVAVNPFTGAKNTVSTNAMSFAAGGGQLMRNPFDVAIEPSGSIVVADQGTTTNSTSNDGLIIRINPATGAQTQISAPNLTTALYDTMGIAVSPPGSPNAGDVYFTDEHGQDGCAGDGAVFRIDAVGTGSQSLVSSNPLADGGTCAGMFRDPQDVVVTAAGEVFVSDDSTLAIIRLDSNGTVHTSFSDNTNSPGAFIDPRHMVQASGGVLLVANSGTVPEMPDSGDTILSVAPTGVATPVSTHADYAFPDGVAVDHAGDIIISDRVAFSFAGALFRSPPSGNEATITSGLDAPHGIAIVPGTPQPPPDVQHALTVGAQGTGAGFVTSAPAGIDCGTAGSGHTDCNESYAQGSVITLTATVTSGTFDGYNGGGCAGASVCQVTMNQAHNVTATFTASSTPPADTTAPNAQKGKGPARTIRTRTATFNFSSEPGAFFFCSLDDKPFKACTSPKKVRRLKKGKHTFKVVAVDSSFNIDPTPATWRFRVAPG